MASPQVQALIQKHRQPPTTMSTTTTTTSPMPGDDGMSTAAKVGIGVGAVAAVGLVAKMVFGKKKR